MEVEVVGGGCEDEPMIEFATNGIEGEGGDCSLRRKRKGPEVKVGAKYQSYLKG